MSSARILIVEDHESTSKSLELIFKKFLFQVDIANSGKEALEMVRRKNQYNLAIVDIRLPDMSGISLLEPLKEKQPHIAIIVVTGYGSIETSVQALNAGAEAYLIKPFNINIVLATIRKVFEKQKIEEQKKKAEISLRESEKRLKVLHELDFAILSLQSGEEIAQAGLEYLAQLIDYKLGNIVLYDKDIDQWTISAVYPQKDYHELMRKPFYIEASEELQRLTSGQILKIKDIRNNETLNEELISYLQIQKIDSIIIVPLIAQDTMMGIINLGRENKRIFSKQSISLIKEIAQPLSIAIHQTNLMKQVYMGRKRLQQLSKQLLDVQEAERRSLALELHDQIGQMLTAVKINLLGVTRLKEPNSLNKHIQQSVNSVDQILQDVRNMALNLRPSMLDDLGLDAALRWLVDRQTKCSGIHVDFKYDMSDKRPSEAIETACFRVAQEALTNVLRHSQATELKMSLSQDDDFLTIIIQDNGKGFNLPKVMGEVATGKSLGLLGMYERVEIVGGELDIFSEIGNGSICKARFPCNNSVTLERRNIR